MIGRSQAVLLFMLLGMATATALRTLLPASASRFNPLLNSLRGQAATWKMFANPRPCTSIYTRLGGLRLSGGSAGTAAEYPMDDPNVKTTTAEERADAEALKMGAQQPAAAAAADAAATTSDESYSLDDFESVDISPSGTFKYVLIEAKDSAGRVKHLVRGYRDSDYHVYAARPTVEELRGKGFSATVLGGGRLLHSPTNNVLRIWGRSHSFGREDKTVTVAVCQERWPDYKITWSNDGY